MDEFPKDFLSAMDGDAQKATRFAGLSEEEKDHILNKARGAKSRREIDELVGRI